ncbi:unnamed protein product [Diamesa tonsa]
MTLIIILIVGAVFLFYKWATSTYDYFAKRGMTFSKPVPLMGSNLNMFTRKLSFPEVIDAWYYEFRDVKISGLFEFRRPFVFVRDPKIVKHLAIKEFDYFMDHRSVITKEIDPMFGKALVALTGQKWKDMRATLSPAFTGSKMRMMFEFMSQCGKQTAITMREQIVTGNDNVFEFRELASKFTVDVIASCAFGIEVNSFLNPKNDFQRIAQKVANFSGFLTTMKFLGFMVAPNIMKKLNISILDKETCDFFQTAILDTMKYRVEKGIVRHDMINLLIQARKGNLSHSPKEDEVISDGFATVEESNMGKSKVTREWDDEDMAAQCFIFFLAGFDTVATTMSFAAYELALNQEVQDKLRAEINDVENDVSNGTVNYEQIQEMKYMDQFICEVLRKWPAALITDRACVKDYELKYDDDKTFTFEKGINFFIPIYSFHRDPQYFQDPEKFDPERFNDENRGNIDPDTYLPFGVGPRNCIGSRFALIELKTIFYYLLLNFKFEVCAKTQIPLKFDKTAFSPKTEKGIHIALVPL